VCKACLKSHQIPTDPQAWLTESGELQHAPTPTPEAGAVPPEAQWAQGLAPDARPSDAAGARAATAHGVEPVFVGRGSETGLPAPVPREPELTGAARSRPARTRVPAPETESTSAVATATPPPARGPVAPVPVPTRADRDTLSPAPQHRYADPIQLQTQADIAAALTATIAARMKPPPAPRRDLRPSTAGWLLLTGIAMALILVAGYTEAHSAVSGILVPALVLAVAQIVIGYAWIVRLTYLREPRRGLTCAVPPLTLYYLGQYKYAKYRPLRFVVTGAALLALTLAVPVIAPAVRPLVVKPPAPAPAPDPAAETKLGKLRAFREQRAYDSLIQLLDVLVVTDPIRSADAKDRAPIAAELEQLCAHPLSDVRIAALAAFPSWDTEPEAARARTVCLKAVRSTAEAERMRALLLLPRWKDADTARAVQSLIGRPGSETRQAAKSLKEIGGAPAEQAGLGLLKRADSVSMRVTAIDILESAGGARAADELKIYAMATDELAVRNRALAAVTTIEERLRNPVP
jgi:hypothetical protein